HVADDVREIGMEELVREKGYESRHPSARTDLADEGGGRQAEGIDEAIERELARPGLVEEDRKVGGNQAPGDDRLHRLDEGIVIVDRHDHARSPRSPILSRLP